jgi:hypothetical protein
MNLAKNTQKLREYKKGLKLTQEQREALLGILLGDGHLETQNGGRTYRLIIEQTRHNEPYIQHLYELFQPWVLTPPKLKKRNTGVHLFFRTISHPAFRFYGKLFYSSEKKVLPKHLHKYFSDRALAYWFMDDGARKGKDRSGKRIHTEGFEESHVRQLCEALNLYGVKTTVQKQKRRLGEKPTVFLRRVKKPKVFCPPYKIFSRKNFIWSAHRNDSNSTPRQVEVSWYYILYITAEGDRVFTEKVKPYIIPFFQYKL